ncbi:hypothetical protein [Pseudomonas putida]|uniref:hypothetical protein n=1 Tax=Pseudomonas putida TaxID=303 RepID=UPI003F81EB9A
MIIVFKPLLPLALSALFLGGCAGHAPSKDKVSLRTDKSAIVGIWAMMPLKSGIANVAEYKADGKVLLHPFNCAEPKTQAVEVSDYKVAEDGSSIHVQSEARAFDLKVLGFAPTVMMLSMPVADAQLTFLYRKVDQVAPLCDLYVDAKGEAARRTPFQASDFAPAPAVPAGHAGLERYIGKWASKAGAVQIEVVRDASGVYLYHRPDENWRYLYNNVRWTGDALAFNSYAYTEKPALFRHPYHKTNTPMTLELLENGQARLTYLIDGKRFDSLLHKTKD